MRLKRLPAVFLLLLCLAAGVAVSQTPAGIASVEITFPAVSDGGPITGRVFVIFSRTNTPEPRLRAGSYSGSVPFFGMDVHAVQPGGKAILDNSVPGFPLQNFKELPEGDYYVQAVLNLYTQVHRKDGHTIWVHMDQWEGQEWNRSPGNLVSEVQRVHVDSAAALNIKLDLSRVLPPIAVPADTEWIKRVKIQSKLLSDFWGHPMYLGATLLLPKGYAEDTAALYPAIYVQGHFGLGAPFPFTPGNGPLRPAETDAQRRARLEAAPTARESGMEFYSSWISDGFPRMIAVSFQHPTPYYDDSYAVNSANNGPYADALLTELIPYLEQHFRIIPKPYARVLTGISTGGWEALALQIQHPTFFNGAWSIAPDPVDFRRNQMIDIYRDDNAFEVPMGEWAKVERPLSRTPQGQVTMTVRQMSQLEAVLGSNIRSGQQIAAWDAAYGPVSPEGYPRPLWDRLTGKIDKEVAAYWRDNGFDLGYYVKSNWPKIGSDLTGKIHVYCGDMDDYYLNLAVYMLEDIFNSATNPPAAATFAYGRPMKPHGWQPVTNAEMIRMMYARIQQTTPQGP